MSVVGCLSACEGKNGQTTLEPIEQGNLHRIQTPDRLVPDRGLCIQSLRYVVSGEILPRRHHLRLPKRERNLRDA